MFELGPGTFLSILSVVVGGTLLFFLRARHIERMAMIHEGIPLHDPERKRSSRFLSIKIGLFMCGIGLGLFMGFVCEHILHFGGFELYPALMFFCGGAGLVLAYFFEIRQEESMPQSNIHNVVEHEKELF
ncbi:MAG: DUF6249 domain-containing protein [Bacteroidota bacterium]